MSFFLELLGEVVFPILDIVCGIFGYRPGWGPTRDDSKERSSPLSVLVWFTAFALLCGILIWLALR
ncbi:MAG: hypothetical protein ABFD16_15360 [Thermoguttaceae bacterium]|jgi:hypothetical protein